MNDDLNTPIVIAHLFDAARMVNLLVDKKATITAADLEELSSIFHLFLFNLLGIKEESGENNKAREEDIIICTRTAISIPWDVCANMSVYSKKKA